MVYNTYPINNMCICKYLHLKKNNLFIYFIYNYNL